MSAHPKHPRAGLVVCCSDGAYVTMTIRAVLTVWGLNSWFRRLRRAWLLLWNLPAPEDEQLDFIMLPGGAAADWQLLEEHIRLLFSIHEYPQNRVALVIHNDCGRVPDRDERFSLSRQALTNLRRLIPRVHITHLSVGKTTYQQILDFS